MVSGVVLRWTWSWSVVLVFFFLFYGVIYWCCTLIAAIRLTSNQADGAATSSATVISYRFLFDIDLIGHKLNLLSVAHFRNVRVADVDTVVLNILVSELFIGTAETNDIIENLLRHLMSFSIQLLQKFVVIIQNLHDRPCIDAIVESFFSFFDYSLKLFMVLGARRSHATAWEVIENPR